MEAHPHPQKELFKFSHFFNMTGSCFTTSTQIVAPESLNFLIDIANYFLNLILTLKEKDLLSPSILNG